MKKLLVSGACVVIGASAFFYLMPFGHQASASGPRGNDMTASAALAVLFSCVAAVVFLFAWFDNRRQTILDNLNPGLSEQTLRLGVKAGVYGLNPGASYRVIREIKDCYGTIFPVGMALTFVQRNFVPYHGGHTVVFRPQPMYLQDEENADVLNHLEVYLEAAGPSPAAASQTG